MSWFGGNLPQLSSITDQISSFTKEVLTETTEEVEDPTAKLQIARRKTDELETLNKHIQTEWEKLKKHNEELNERAETAEYQIATISQEYRKLLQEKDEELRRLKVDRERLREQQKGLVHGSSGKDGLSPQSPLKQLASSQFFSETLVSTATTGSSQSNIHNGPGGFEGVDLEDGDFHDFGDVISSQSEINRLQSELARLKVECQHWKTAAQQKESSLELEAKESDVAQLKGRIEELELSLQQEIVQHQRELSGLQTVQNERLNSLTQRHQHEVDQLQSKINKLERERASNDGSSCTASPLNYDEKEGAELKMKCAELEEEVKKLTERIGELERRKDEQLQQLSSENVRLSEVNRRLESQLKREQATMSGLQREITSLKEQFSQKRDSESAVLEQEKRELTSKLTDMQTSISEQESVLSRLQQECGQSQLEVEQLTGKVERLSHEVQAKEREIHSLQGVVKSDSRDKERVASDLASVLKELEEKNRLVNELKRSLGGQNEVLKERESELSSQKELTREASNKEAKLRQQYSELEQRHSQEVKQLKLQLAAAEKVQTVQVETAASASESQESLSKLKEELVHSRTQLHEAKQEMARVLSEKDKLLGQREEEMADVSAKLDVSTCELQQARAEVLRISTEKEMLSQQRNGLQAEVVSLSQVRGQLESKVRSLEESGHSVGEELRTKLEAKEQECVKYNKQLTNLKAHLIEVEERYTQEAVLADQRESGLKQEAANLQEQLKATSHQGAMQSEQTQQELEVAQRELRVMMEEKNDALLQMTNAQEQAKQNAAALRNLQAVLEEFQRDQSSELAQALKRSQTELASALQESHQLKGEVEELRARLVEANGAAEAAAILNQELEDGEKKVAEFTREIENLRRVLAQKEQVLSQLSKIELDRVDRNLVKNLVLGYIHASDRKKPEVVQLIHKILDFSPEELEMAMKGCEGGGAGGGWLSGLWGRKQPTTPKTPPPDKATSLSRLFVNFLESESTPTTKAHPPILPTSSAATPPGYIDPRTDPDRPSLATAPLLKPHPLHTMPSHTPPGGGGGPRPTPDQKPSPIPIPELTTSHSIDSRQVSKGHESRPLEQNKQQNAPSSLFLFTPARPNSADSAGSTETNQVSGSSQSSILRNVLS